jgi:hypothetical protein
MSIARTAPRSGLLKGCQIAPCGLLAVLFLGTAPPPSTDPYQIYDRAQAVWRSQAYPDDIQYRITTHVSEGKKDELEHYNGEASITRGIRVAGDSDEELAKPHRATGINFKINIEFGWNTNAGGNLGSMLMDAHRKEASPDYLGVPMISPEYSFGLGPLLQPEPALQQEENPPKSAFPIIATVTATDQPYDITLAGTEVIGGFYTYHLRLQPRHDPAKYRLRDLWIDSDSYVVLKLVTQGNFTGPPMNAVPWVVTFQDIGGATYIDTEKAEAPLAFRGDRTFTTATVSFSDIRRNDLKLPTLPFLDSGQILREP